MGTRIAYFISNNTKRLLENFNADFEVFRSWVLLELEQYGGLSSGIGVSINALNILKAKDCKKENLSEDLLDELIAIYLDAFCESDEGKGRYTHTGSSINKWKYEKSTEMVNDRCDEITKHRWNYLIGGRSVTDENKPSKTIVRGEVLFGYWKTSELAPFLNALISEFGTKEEFTDYYYSKERIDKIFTSECAGLECVYDILEEGIQKNREIIIYIEM